MVTAQATQKIRLPSPFLVLESRSRYSTTHICLPDDPQRLPAIQVGPSYYSFMQAIAMTDEVLKWITRLCDRNYSLVLAKIPKGYSVWVEEPTAVPQNLLQTEGLDPTPALCYYLHNPEQYDSLRLRIPKLDLPVLGILFSHRYYSIFCKESDFSQVLEIVAQLAEWGNETLIISHNQGFMICILEPEAQPAN